MESNHQNPVPSNLIREPNNQLEISYHRRYPDGEYVPPMVSLGFRFCPEDDELIVDFLNKEINKEPAPYIRIPKVNVYMYTPEELTESHQSMGKDEWYFFSPRDRKYLNGNRPNRAAGYNGYWKATSGDQRISRNGEFVGSKKSLVFYVGKAPKGNKTNWIMKEYMTNQPRRQHLPNYPDDMRLDDCVLCRIYKNSKYYSPIEEKEAAASEHEGTNQQHNLRVRKPNIPMQQLNLPTPQQNLQVLQKNLSMPQQNQQAMQCILQPWSNNLCGQLNFRPESIPEKAQPIMLQPNHPTPKHNPQAIMQYSHQPWIYNLGGQLDFRPESNPNEAQPIMLQQNPQAIMQYSHQPCSYNFGGQLDFRPESNPEEAQPIFMLQPNHPMPQQNLQATQCSLQAGTGGQLDFPMESISEEANQFHFDNLGNSHENFDDFTRLTWTEIYLSACRNP